MPRVHAPLVLPAPLTPSLSTFAHSPRCFRLHTTHFRCSPVVLKHASAEVADNLDVGDGGAQGLDLGAGRVEIDDVSLRMGAGDQGDMVQ